ncbi:Conserved hypothetical protein [Bacteriophage APSE-7]|nr:Conserved hypothetical protein [Bacteriophage APSE-7]
MPITRTAVVPMEKYFLYVSAHVIFAPVVNGEIFAVRRCNDLQQRISTRLLRLNLLILKECNNRNNRNNLFSYIYIYIYKIYNLLCNICMPYTYLRLLITKRLLRLLH